MTSNFGQYFPSTPRQDKYPKWPLKPVTSFSSQSSFVIFIKGNTITKIGARLKPELWLTSYSAQVFPKTPHHTSTQNDLSNWRQNSDWPHVLARSFLQHPSHVPKMISQTHYWFELPDSPSSFVIFIKRHWWTKIEAGLKPVIWLTSYFGQVFPTTPQTCTQNDFSNRLLVWAPCLHFLFSCYYVIPCKGCMVMPPASLCHFIPH